MSAQQTSPHRGNALRRAQGLTGKAVADIGGAAGKAGQALTAFGGSGQRAFKVIEGGARGAQASIVQSVNAQRGVIQNLQFQLNDIATQLASGASPFQVMAQQGGQVVQALSGAGGVVGVLRLIGAAATNPFTLATIAITTLAAVSAEFFRNSTQDAEEATKALKAHADLVEDLAKQYGGLIPELERLARIRREEADAAGLAAAKETALEEAYSNTAKTTQDLHGQVIDLLSTLEAIGVPAKDLSDLQKQFDLLAKAVEDHKASAEDAQPVLQALNGIIDNGHGKVVKMATAIRDQLVTSFRELNDAAASAARTVDNFNAPAFLRGAGGAGDVGAMLERLRTQEIGGSRTAEFIKAQESFIPHAKFDVNAFTRGGGRSLGGVERTIRTDRGFWRIELQGIIVRTREQKRVWNAIRTKLGGRAGLLAIPVKSFDTAPFLSGDYEKSQLVNHSDGTSFSDGSSYRQGAISLKTATRAAIGDTMIAIQFVNAAASPSGIRFSHQNALYETGTIIGQSNDIYSVDVFPAIRKSIPAGSTLKAEPPWCMVHLAEDDGMALAEGKRLASEANVAFVEATDYWSDGGS